MKLNPDCIRDILLAVEELPDVKHHIVYNRETIAEHFPNYSYEEICYHLRQCDLFGFFYKSCQTLEGNWYIMDLSPKAHEFLADIRQDNIWQDVKKISSTIGTSSLSALVNIATNLVKQLITNYFHI